VNEPRPEVQAFADAMEIELQKNDHKGGWKTCPDNYLINKLLEETAELIEATIGIDGDNIWGLIKRFGDRCFEVSGKGGDKISEAADIGNIAMMLADPERKSP
jgi:hypothetical protein